MTTSITGCGVDYEHRLSKAAAQHLVGEAILPRMGWERDLKVVPYQDFPAFKQYLTLQNVSGIYLLVSHTTPKANWGEVFGPEFEVKT